MLETGQHTVETEAIDALDKTKEVIVPSDVHVITGTHVTLYIVGSLFVVFTLIITALSIHFFGKARLQQQSCPVLKPVNPQPRPDPAQRPTTSKAKP